MDSFFWVRKVSRSIRIVHVLTCIKNWCRQGKKPKWREAVVNWFGEMVSDWGEGIVKERSSGHCGSVLNDIFLINPKAGLQVFMRLTISASLPPDISMLYHRSGC